MAFESLTNERISNLLTCPKKITNSRSRSKLKDGHEQYNYKVISLDESGHNFEIYVRQNVREGMDDDFSCGISWLASNGEALTLKRYNGPSHNHPNHLENEKSGFNCHIQIATEKYIKANRKPEGFAESTTRYKTIKGALHCLIIDCNILGLTTEDETNEQVKLF